MRQRRLRPAVAVLTALLVLALLTPTAGARADAPGDWLGNDGQMHSFAPLNVPGHNGQAFLGWDFDVACWAAGAAQFRTGLNQLTQLARVIRKSGRRALFTVAPNKTSVLTKELVRPVPHGDCALSGLRAQEQLIDGPATKTYVPVRRLLAEETRQVYWRTDTHWTSVGASVWVKAVARALDPRLAKRQRFVPATVTLLGDIYTLDNRYEPETAHALRPGTHVDVETTRGIDPAKAVTFDLSWRTSPVRKTWRGRTLVLGDSFAFAALPLMRPLFARGRWLWLDHSDIDAMVKAIVKADTVVIEKVQRMLISGEELGFRRLLIATRAALRAHPRP